MKKIVIIALIALLAVSAVFARGNTQDTSTTAAASGQPRIILLTDSSGIDDKSYNAAAWRGILEFYGDTWANPAGRGRYYEVVTAQTQDMYIPNLMQAVDEGYDLIVATGFTFADAVQEVANRYPQQKFMIVDVDFLSGSNILQTTYAEHEGSYLVGVAAALKAQEDGIVNPRFGFIGGIPNATITKFEVGYIQGILSVLPNAQIVDYYANNWADPALAKTQAKNWYDSGVYMIYSAAGYTGSGTIAQAKEYRADGRNIWTIGVDSDQHDDGLYTATDSAVYTSMIKMVESSLLYALNAVKNNTFRGEKISFALKDNGVGYSSVNRAMSQSIKTRLEEVKAQIISGQIRVAPTYAESRRLPNFPQNLLAIDD